MVKDSSIDRRVHWTNLQTLTNPTLFTFLPTDMSLLTIVVVVAALSSTLGAPASTENGGTPPLYPRFVAQAQAQAEQPPVPSADHSREDIPIRLRLFRTKKRPMVARIHSRNLSPKLPLFFEARKKPLQPVIKERLPPVIMHTVWDDTPPAVPEMPAKPTTTTTTTPAPAQPTPTELTTPAETKSEADETCAKDTVWCNMKQKYKTFVYQPRPRLTKVKNKVVGFVRSFFTDPSTRADLQ